MAESQDSKLFDNLDQLITYEQLSKWLCISVSTLEKYVHRREIPAIKLNAKVVRFRVEDVKNWLHGRTIGVQDNGI